MLKPTVFAVCLLGAVVYASYDAYSQQTCATDTKCPCRDWAEVQKNLEVTANTPGEKHRGCAEARVHGGETAYKAFQECNKSNETGGIFGGASPKYENCAPYVCNWFKAQTPPWSPAC